jgi:hypothetical protein
VSVGKPRDSELYEEVPAGGLTVYVAPEVKAPGGILIDAMGRGRYRYLVVEGVESQEGYC